MLASVALLTYPTQDNFLSLILGHLRDNVYKRTQSAIFFFSKSSMFFKWYTTSFVLLEVRTVLLLLKRGDAWCNGQHVCFLSLPPMLLCGFESRLQRSYRSTKKAVHL